MMCDVRGCSVERGEAFPNPTLLLRFLIFRTKSILKKKVYIRTDTDTWSQIFTARCSDLFLDDSGQRKKNGSY